MNSFTLMARTAVIASALFATAAFADPVPLTSFLVSSDQTQKGRLSRNGIQQDYPGDEAYPGIINPTLSYHFHAYSFNVGNTPFVDITFDSLSVNTFISAYQTSYFPANPGLTWLGDPGTSGNYFSGTDPLFFSFTAALNSTIVLLVNETTPNAGLGAGNTFTIYAQGSSDSNFSDLRDLQIVSGASVIPEPETLLLLAGPLAGLAFVRRRKTVGAVA